MKHTPFLLLGLLLTGPASAQWLGGNAKIWTDDRVGIMTSNPLASLEVGGIWGGYPALRVRQEWSNAPGLIASTVAHNRAAISGTASHGSGEYTNGVVGTTYSTEGFGVRGVALAGSGENCGVYGGTNSTSGYSGRFAGGKFQVTGEFAGINRDFQITPAEVFGVTAKTHGFGGMYMETRQDGKPFYGYAIDNSAKAYHHYDSATAAWRLVIGSGALLVATATGRVGIGTSDPQHKLHVAGDAAKPGGGSWTATSDRRLKKNVEPLEGSLDRLLELRGVRFEFLDPEAIGERGGRQVGVIAQEVEPVFPDWVDEGADGFKRVTFRGFEALTVEALRELRAEQERALTEVRAELAALRATNEALRAELARAR